MLSIPRPVLRPGHTYRVYDFERRDGSVAFVVALDHSAHGGGYSPQIAVHVNRGRGYIGGWSVYFPVPVLTFRLAYRLRHLAALKLYSVMQRAVYALFSSPRVAEVR